MNIDPSGENNQDGQIISEINMTPLIDIMLVLLIIFMVTSSVSLESGIDVDLPQMGKGSTAQEQGEYVVISFDRGGRIFVQGDKVDLDRLREKIEQALVAAKTTTVVFEGDKSASLGEAMRIMDIAKTAGATRFAIAADSEEKSQENL